MMELVTIEGKAGSLEAHLELQVQNSCCAVLCHPHPLYGGSMHDQVLTVLAQSMSSALVGTLAFNFRGVGASEGCHDNGVGEVDDVVSAVEWLQREKGITSIVLCGYSFGALMVLNALPRLEVEKAILVAPPVGRMSACKPEKIPMLVILGEEDEIVDSESTAAFFSSAEVHTIGAVDHFFVGAAGEIQARVAGFMNGA
ncbi:MAG: hypothetical protein CMQ19_14510 [Gammaproteobacteria bacterium]|nr:hypothetical protein [Gammaproteobacteria bacterium]|tara:strand:- start:1723 stop:2319 length:597 start_codon:yes stop_codon:yes gene_type:complete